MKEQLIYAWNYYKAMVLCLIRYNLGVCVMAAGEFFVLVYRPDNVAATTCEDSDEFSMMW